MSSAKAHDDGQHRRGDQLDGGGQPRQHLGHRAAEVRLARQAVHARERLVDAHVAQVLIEDGDADSGALDDGFQDALGAFAFALGAAAFLDLGAQLQVGCTKLGGARLHAAFQLGVRALQARLGGVRDARALPHKGRE